MSGRILFPLLFVLVLTASACGGGGSDCVVGVLGCACDSAGQCGAPNECLSGVCVAPKNNPGGDGGPTGGREGGSSGAAGRGGRGGASGGESGRGGSAGQNPAGAGADAGTDAGTDAGADAGTDAGGDAGTVTVAPECVGGAGTNVCVEARLVGCDAAGQSTTLGDCDSARHCEGGRAAGACLACLAGEHRCEGTELERCADDGSGFEGVETCATAEICNAEAGSCAAGCSAGQHVCNGMELRRCRADLTGFEMADQCASADLCDAAGGECDDCVPGQERCTGQVFETCNSTGQGWNMENCAASSERCTAAGCVDCVSNTDCSTSMTCREAYCDLGSATCATRAATTCRFNATTDGVCTSGGACVRCTQDTHCGSPTPFCSGMSCVQCRGAGDCNGAFAVCNGGTCGIGPGCGNGRIDPGEECERGVSPGAGMGTWGASNCTADCLRTVYQNCSTSERIAACDDHRDANCLIGLVVGLYCIPEVDCTAATAGFCPRAPGYTVACGEPWTGVRCYLSCDDDSDCPADLYCSDPNVRTCCTGSTPNDSCNAYCNNTSECSPGETCLKVSSKMCIGRQL
jgi:hypothetical protein